MKMKDRFSYINSDMKKFSICLFIFLFCRSISFGQLFSHNCNGGINILPIEDINICNNSDWLLVLEDDFNVDSLDFSKWRNEHDHGTQEFNNERHFVTMRNIEIDEGVLKIVAKKEQTLGLAVAWRDSNSIVDDGLVNLRWYDYSTAYLVSNEYYGYGYFEASCKIPSGQGFWPAMWMWMEYPGPDNIKISEEIDVFEFWENDPTDHNMNVHYNNNACLTDYIGPDFSKDFHTYAILWEPNIIEWYVDGEVKKRFPRYYQNGSEVSCNLNAWQPYQEAPFPRSPLSLRFNLAIDDREGNKPDDSTIFPATFEIDWIRYYVREDFINKRTSLSFYSLVYPNPANGNVTIEIDERFSGNVSLLVYSMQFQLIHYQNLNNNISQIDLGFLENGVYLFKIVNEESSNANFHKVIISK